MERQLRRQAIITSAGRQSHGRSPQKIIAEGTDWRFLNELKKELKR